MIGIDGEAIYIISCFLLLTLAIMVTFRKKGSNLLARRFLSAYFWCFFYAALVSYLVLYTYITQVPHLFRTAFLTWSLVMPFSYLYFQQSLYPRRLKLTDGIHFLPFLVYLVDYFPFFLWSGEEKLALLMQLTSEERRTGFNEGWFMPKQGYYIIRLAQIIFYLVAETRLMIKVGRSADHPMLVENPVQFTWLKFMVGSQFLILLGPLFSAAFLHGANIGAFTNFATLLLSIIQFYFLLFHPQVLFEGYYRSFDERKVGMATELFETSPLIVYDQRSPVQPEQPSLYYSDEILDEVSRIVENHMAQYKPYLKPGYKLSALAEETGQGVHKLSACINRQYNMNFYSYLNKFRIEEILHKLSANEQATKTLEALAEECGFQTRSTFIRAFKSHTGFTPSEYLSGKKQQN